MTNPPATHISKLSRALTLVDQGRIDQVSDALQVIARTKGTLYVAGNGGSAALASHMAADLAKATRFGRSPRVLSLVDNSALVSMIANDEGFAEVFAYQLRNQVGPGDGVLLISCSGLSMNLVRAAEAARELGAATLALLGFGGGRLVEVCDTSVVVESSDYRVVEDVHHAIAHQIADTLLKQRVPVRIAVLDRDGVIGPAPAAGEYVINAESFRWADGAREAIRDLNAAGVRVVIATNQRGVALGLMSSDDLDRIHDRIRADLHAIGAAVDAIYVCPHELTADCPCRKPRAGMLHQAARELSFGLEECVVIGDSPADIAMAQRAGVRPILVGQAKVGDVEHYDDLAAAVRSLLNECR